MEQNETKSVTERYELAVASGQLRFDAAQRTIAEAFDAMRENRDRSLFSALPRLINRLSRATHDSAGIYLWGDVGRGKSMLMDMFVASMGNSKTTRRVHFHAFMVDIHQRLFAYRQHRRGDVMERLIRELVHEIDLLCLDEFQVTDVTDAMILARLFSGLMDGGVTVVFTSNRPPQDLYQGGLQREQFLKFVELLENRVSILSLNSPYDYRLAQLKSLTSIFVYPLNALADDFILTTWNKLTNETLSEPLWLSIQGRTLRIDKHVKGVAWLTFEELCVRPLGANDYLTLARCCHTLLLQGIPKLSAEYRNEAKRLVTLIDALYDHRVKLIATADAAPDALYPNGDGSFEFHRTASRLHEMQTDAYLALPHLT